MDEYISASKYYKQDTRVQNGTRPQYHYKGTYALCSINPILRISSRLASFSNNAEVSYC